MSERQFDWKRDGGGLAVFAVGSFFATVMFLALRSDQPLDEIGGTAAIAMPLARGFGAFPMLVLAAGFAFLGARSFLKASDLDVLRHALGLIGCSLGLTVLFGALSDTGGGAIGVLTGGLIGLHTHATLGGLVGLLVLATSFWYSWLREPGLHHAEQIRSSVKERAPVVDPGVTPAEAAGLIPEEMPQVLGVARKSAYALPATPPVSPYPEDVRLKGQVPAGARPIATTNADAPIASPPRAAPIQPLEPRVEPLRPVAPGTYLAAAATAAAPTVPAAPAREVRPFPEGVHPLAPADHELSEDRAPLDEQREAPALERPTWEQTGLAEDDEPVDAYGTPLSLVESLRLAQVEMLAVPESPAAVAEIEEAELEPDEEEEEEEEGSELFAEEESDEEQDAEAEELDLEEEEPEIAPAPQELDGAVLAETEEFAGESEELEIAEELVPAAELEPVADVQALAQTTIFDFTGDEQAMIEVFPGPVAEAPAAEEPIPQPIAAVQQESAPPAVPEAEIEIDIGEEPEVILQPQAAPAERSHKSLSVDPQRAKLLVEAGCLFVERGRVAVSMLQRQYGMDFDDACKVLDELQDAGLIGPYLGGQRRDILLTRDQWLEKVGAE